MIGRCRQMQIQGAAVVTTPRVELGYSAIMGEVIELGSEVTNLKIGDRVVVPFTISCGQCWFCEKGLFSCCDRTNPNAELAAKAMGQSPAGLFGFSHMNLKREGCVPDRAEEAA